MLIAQLHKPISSTRFASFSWAGRAPQVSTVPPLQIHRLAACCIQRNMAVFLAVKDWPWWQLFGSLRPLLSATIGEEQLHAKEVGPCGGHRTPSFPSVCIQTRCPHPCTFF